jgi:hypothetical protein
VIEELREPRASSAEVMRASELAPAARKPFFLHLRCRLGTGPSRRVADERRD